MLGDVTVRFPLKMSAGRFRPRVLNTVTLASPPPEGWNVTVPVNAFPACPTKIEAPTVLAVKVELPPIVRAPPTFVMFPVAAVAKRFPVIVTGPRSRAVESTKLTLAPLVTETLPAKLLVIVVRATL
jgi:hypothetical protein